MARRKRRAAAWLAPLGLGLGAAALVAAGCGLYAERRLSRFVLGGLGESFSTRVWSAPYALGGSAAPPPRLITRLERLGYQSVLAQPARAGQYFWRPPVMTVWLRGFESPLAGQPPGVVSLRRSGELWQVDGGTRPAQPGLLEPELAAELSGPQKIRRDPAESEEIPESLKDAVIAAEDKRFHTHWGLDFRAIGRALWSNVRGRGVLQGASTITQQLAKNVFLTPRRTLRRKLYEALLALYLELRFGKERILTLYLNHIYLGQEGPVSIAGVKAAARFYFDKELVELSLPESALIAGVIRSPHRYNPYRDAGAARERRDFVLRRMREEGLISAREAAEARRTPLEVKKSSRPKTERHDDDYFVAEVVRQLVPRHGEQALYQLGLSVYTTMDPLLQHDAQAAIKRLRHQGALVALDPGDGRVLAIVGGRDFSQSQFNRATQAERQPGSAFKPFVYAAALEKGYSLATILEDKPRSYQRSSSAAASWDPRNYAGVYLGTATARVALSRSLNAATLDLASRTGVNSIVELARRLGIASPLAADLGVALGASETNLLELSAAYSAFANGGLRVEPRLIEAVLDAEGSSLEAETEPARRELSPATAYLMISALESVVRGGTASSLGALGFSRPAAGKTGTTNDGRDAWFVGFVPGLLAGVWVGDDQHRRIGATGAKDALPAWAAFMSAAASDRPESWFERPADGLAEETIDPMTGGRARAGCPEKLTELFATGTEPTEDCPLHLGGLRGLFKRWFGK